MQTIETTATRITVKTLRQLATLVYGDNGWALNDTYRGSQHLYCLTENRYMTARKLAVLLLKARAAQTGEQVELVHVYQDYRSQIMVSEDPHDEPICCKYATAGVEYKPE